MILLDTLCNSEAIKIVERGILKEWIYEDFLAMLSPTPSLKAKHSEIGFKETSWRALICFLSFKSSQTGVCHAHEIPTGGW